MSELRHPDEPALAVLAELIDNDVSGLLNVRLLLSGLLDRQADALCQHYAGRIELRVAATKDNWVCLRGTSPPGQ